jgi:hypothetical protein
MSLIKNLIFFITSMSVFNIAHAGWLDLNMTQGVTDKPGSFWPSYVNTMDMRSNWGHCFWCYVLVNLNA